MTCPKHDDLSAYLDGMLPPGESARLASHVPHCPACRQYVDQLQALQQSLRQLPSPALGFDLAARLEGRLHAPPSRRQPSRPFWAGWAPAGMGAMASLVVGVWLGGLLVGGAVSAPPAALTMRVFDPAPPGGLCAAAELCRLSKGMR